MRFKVGDLIRNKRSGKPYLVVFTCRVSILVIDPETINDPMNLYAILFRDFEKYRRDIEMKCMTTKQFMPFDEEYINKFSSYRRIVI